MPEKTIAIAESGIRPANPPVAVGNPMGTQNAINCRMWLPMLVLVLAAVMRLAASVGDLAIDEIWSWLFVRSVITRFVDIFALRHDNNHILNTMVMYWLGPDVPGICYRLPAVAASIVSVWLAGRIAMRRGGYRAASSAWTIVGMSYLLILYGSEARGYSYAVFFAYLSWLCLLRIPERGRWADALAFALSASLGFLSHLTFLYCYAGFCVWTFWMWVRKPSWILVIPHIPPIFVATGLYLLFIRGMAIGGGPETTIASATISTLSIIGGGPLYDDGALISAVLVACVLGFGFFRLCQTDLPIAACYATIIFLMPAIVLSLTGHQLVYPRYFLIPVAFALLVIGDVVAGTLRAGFAGRVVPILIVAAYVTGNGWWTARLLDHGRGDYSRALSWMATHVDQGAMTVSSDHDFRNRMVFEYFASCLGPDRFPLTYFDQRDVPEYGTDWLIRHNFDGDPLFPKDITDVAGNPYKLERTYWHRSLTGWNWWIYRRKTTHR